MERTFLTLCVSLLLAAGPAFAQVDTQELPAAGPAQRIWSEETAGLQTLWFRRSFAISTEPKTGWLVVSCDNLCKVYVNGKLVAQADDWEKLLIVNVGREVRDGDNTIAVEATNEGGPAALALWLIWQNAAGDQGEVVTDASWQVSERQMDGWHAPGFDDSGWKTATAQGETPFGRNVHGSVPKGMIYVSPYSKAAAGISEALQRIQAATNVDAALQALDRLERALMAARRALWELKRKTEERRRR